MKGTQQAVWVFSPWRGRLTLIVIAAAAVLLLSGCDRGVSAFGLEGPHHDGRYTIRERPGRPPEDEGRVIDGTTSRYRFDAFTAEGSSAQLAVRYQGNGTGLEARVYDTDGTLVAARRLPAGEDLALMQLGQADTIVAVPLPSGAAVASFDVVSVASTSDPEFQIRGVQIGPVVGGFRTDASLYLGPGVRVAVSRDGTGESAPVRFRITLPEEPEGRCATVVTYYRDRYAVGEPPFVADTAAVIAGSRAQGAADADDGVALTVRLRVGENPLYLQPAVVGGDPREITLTTDAVSFRLVSVTRAAVPDESAVPPIPTDLGSVLIYPAHAWRSAEYELFRWAKYPAVLVMDTMDYAVQSRFFKRLAFFVEKQGYRGQLVSDDQLAGRHGYNAHNYNGAGLAAFFTAADQSGFALNEHELLLRRIVLDAGIIRSSEDGYVPGPGGIVSVSRESGETPGLRELLLGHEAYHGIYYSEPEYVREVREIWQGAPEPVKRLFRLFLGAMHYDVSDQYLLENEFQAYVLQQPHDSVRWYFRSRVASRLAQWLPHEQAWLEAFYTAHPSAFWDLSLALNAALFSRTGFSGGEVFTIAERRLR